LDATVSEHVIDLESLLQPISDDNPVGTDPRSDRAMNSLFRRTKDAREEARRLEKQAEIEGSSPAESFERWRDARKLATELLTNEAKDLEIAAYLIEALLRTNQFAGLADGLRLACGLIERYGDDIYPLPDEDGLETRYLPLIRLDGEVLAGTIRRMEVTQGSSLEPLMIWQYRQATDLEQCTPEERQTRLERNAASLEMFRRAVSESDPEFFRETDRQLRACREELENLSRAIADRWEDDRGAGSSFSTVREALEEGSSVLKLIAGPHLVVKTESAGGAGGDGSMGLIDENSIFAGGLDGRENIDIVIAQRENAFRALECIAVFFERTEPQSLIPALLRKAIRWGKMSPERLYAELVEDSAVREQIFKLAGINPDNRDGSDDYGGSESSE